MKKRMKVFLTIVLVICCTVSLCACGKKSKKTVDNDDVQQGENVGGGFGSKFGGGISGDQSGSDTTGENTTGGNTAGGNTSGGNTTGGSTVDGNVGVSSGTTDVSKIKDLPAYLYGTYKVGYDEYTTEWIIINETSITYHTPEKDYTYTADEFEITVNQSQTSIEISKNYASYISIYYSRNDTGFMLNITISKLGEKALENVIYASAYYTTVINYMPIDGYTNVDSEGTWGPIPYDTYLSEVLTDKLTDDYYINYQKGYNCSTYSNDEYVTYNADYYVAGCFAEEGNHYYRENCAYVFQNEADAQLMYNYYKNDKDYSDYSVYTLNGCVLAYHSKYYDSADAQLYSDNSNGKKEYMLSNGMVCGIHCFVGDYRTMYYSDSLEKADIQNELTVAEKMADYPNYSTMYSNDGNCELYINKYSIMCGINITLYEDSIYMYSEKVQVVNDKVVVYDADTYSNFKCFSTFEKNGETLIIKTKRFNYDTDVDFTNFSTMTAVKEYEHTFTIPIE